MWEQNTSHVFTIYTLLKKLSNICDSHIFFTNNSCFNSDNITHLNISHSHHQIITIGRSQSIHYTPLHDLSILTKYTCIVNSYSLTYHFLCIRLPHCYPIFQLHFFYCTFNYTYQKIFVMTIMLL